MKNIYTFAAEPAQRTVTIADLRANKGKRKFVQVTANTPDEARAVEEAGIDMMICDGVNVETVRAHNKTTFCTAVVKITEHATTDDIMREAFRVLNLGADAIITPRSFKTVETLAREDIPVMGHLGLVPRKSIWIGGLRAVGKTADEAVELYKNFKRLENAGAFAVEAEVIPAPVLAEISPRTSLITVSLGSGLGGDVSYLFMNDLCGETRNPPRHARAFGNLADMYDAIYSARVDALQAFKTASLSDAFPAKGETAGIDGGQLETFRETLAAGVEI